MKLLTWLRNPESIGLPECPLMHRWTVHAGARFKLLIHHFLPEVEDPDVHDHPRGFVTIVLWGSYDDMVPCDNKGCSDGYLLGGWMGGTPQRPYPDICPRCDRGKRVGEHMRAGMIRRRKAEHAHSTRTGRRGCWTVCIMGRETRPWGFWREGVWWSFRDYAERFGFARRCP